MTYPQFEYIEEAATWWDALQVNPTDKVNMVRYPSHQDQFLVALDC